jgi:hypothetical protein
MATTAATGKASSERPRGDGKQSASAPERAPRTATVNLPFLTATFRIPDVPAMRLPARDDVSSAVSGVQGYLPSPRQAAYYGGLAALAAFELLEWPVALAIGAGTAILERSEVAMSRRAPAEPAEAKAAS